MKPATIVLSISLVLVMLLSAGCITKSQELGCCVKANATKDGKCLWFNMSNDAFINMYPNTTSCNQTDQMCNVTMVANSPAYEIPFCTNDNITQCIKPDCLAMACGDFNYAPQVAPGVASAEEAANNAPATNGSSSTKGLYDAQCRLMPLDSKFEARMKTSKSAINDFRFGIGQDFDEYDYYHYYFPISDRYCMINPTGTIDRYMNYLQPGATQGSETSYDPATMTADCTTDAAPAAPASFPPTPSILPLSYTGTNELENISQRVALMLNPNFIVDDKSYKYVDYLGYGYRPKTDTSSKGVVTVEQPKSLSNMRDLAYYYYEKLDKSYYREALSTAYIPQFYNTNVGRAPFECDQQAYECLSGNCMNDFYNRGVNVVTDSNGQDSFVATDCKNAKDINGQDIVVCYPTVSANNDGGTANIDYANVTYRPWQMYVSTEDYDTNQLDDKGTTDENALYFYGQYTTVPVCVSNNEGKHDKCQMDWLWKNFFTSPLHGDFLDPSGVMVNLNYHWARADQFYFTGSYDEAGNPLPVELFGAPVTVKLLPSDFSISWDPTTNAVDSSVDTTGAYPPAGQITFFNNQNVKYQGQTIVGYAVADPGSFEKTYFAKSCIFDTRTTYQNYSFYPCAGDVCYHKTTRADCQSDCMQVCPAVIAVIPQQGTITNTQVCTKYCNAYVNDTTQKLMSPEPPAPCNFSVTGHPDADAYIKVDLSGTGDAFYKNYQSLMTAFEPLYNDTVAAYSASTDWNDKCGPWNSVDINDLFFASMPWIPEYKKLLDNNPPGYIIPGYVDNSGDDSDGGGGGGGGDPVPGVGYVLNSPALNFFRDKDNTYQQPTSGSPYFTSDTLCNIEKLSARQLGIGQSANDWEPIAYQALVPSTVYLLKGTTDANGNMKVGRCNIVQGSTLPEIRTFGWCEPCTLATLAYQKVTTDKFGLNIVTVPTAEQELKVGMNKTPICTIVQGSGNLTTSCSSQSITDISDYSGLFLYDQFVLGSAFTPEGAPRTDQDPALIKERMGNYLKSGIMPVIDLSDDSDWNLTAPYQTGAFVNSSGELQASNEYQEYDFQKLLGNSGAIVAIVDNFNPSSPSFSRNRILNRTAMIRASCPRCLTAVRLAGSSAGFSKFNDSLSKLFGADPRLKINVDMIVTDYNTADYANGGAMTATGRLVQHADVSMYGISSMPPEFRAWFILNDMANYGQLALNYSKPLMITNFTLNSDQYWNDSTYETLFTYLIDNEDQLMKSGIIGMIYQPVRAPEDSSQSSLVNESVLLTPYGFSQTLDLAGGEKTQKFCALERAVDRMAGTNPYATFVQVYTVPSVNCTLCTSLELAQGLCSQTCDNGVSCTMPTGLTQEELAAGYKCPDDTVVEPCTPCNKTNAVYHCTRTFGNGTSETQPDVLSSVMSTDAYQDVMAATSKPGKCCLTDANGDNYTYFKKMYYTSVTAPAVFSKTGDPNQDCGIGTGNSLTQLGGFCGITLPVKNFDITCNETPK